MTDGDGDGTGLTIQLSGREFALPSDRLYPALDVLRDKLYDTWVLDGADSITPGDAREVLAALLAVRYPALSDDSDPELLEAVASGLLAADPNRLRSIALFCLFGSEMRLARSAFYSDWARSGLRANGIDPASLTALERADVLRHLERTGRVIPKSEWVDAIAAAAQ